jgi:hypothetical protein
LLITAPTAEVDPADPIIRVVDAAVYLRPARGGLMVGGFEPEPRREPRVLCRVHPHAGSRPGGIPPFRHSLSGVAIGHGHHPVTR